MARDRRSGRCGDGYVAVEVVTGRGDRGWLTNFAPKVRFSKNCIIFAHYHSVHTF